MKTTLISEGDLVNIILTPENEFEKDVIKKVFDSEVFSSAREKFEIKTSFELQNGTHWSDRDKHQINLSITKLKEAQQ